MRLAVPALFAFAAVAFAAEPPKEAVEKELARFQGEWKAEKVVTNGREVPEAELKDMRLTIKGDKRVLKSRGEVKAESTFAIDPTTTPKRITVTVSAGPLKGRKLVGIYELTDDTLTICMNPKGDDPPKELASKAGTGHQLQKFTRVKKE